MAHPQLAVLLDIGPLPAIITPAHVHPHILGFEDPLRRPLLKFFV